MCLGSWLSYRQDLKLLAWFPWAITGISVINGLLWVWVSRVSTGRTLYSLSIAMDGVTILAYSLLPLILFAHIRLTPLAGLGVGLVILGACLVKWG